MISVESRLQKEALQTSCHRQCVQSDNFAGKFFEKITCADKPKTKRGCTDPLKPFTSGSRGQKPVIVKGA